MYGFKALFESIRDFAVDSPINAVAVIAAGLALALTPIAVALLGAQRWFQARRGRTLQRPSFISVVVATMLIMAVPAIFLAMVVKSQYFDEDRYEFDPNRTLSVLDQGRQYEVGPLRQRLELADAAVQAEMKRLANERKALQDAVKELDEALLSAGEAASKSKATATPMIPVVEAMGAARAAVGVDSEPAWDAVIAQLESAPEAAPMIAYAAGPGGLPAPSPTAAPVSPFEAEISAVPTPVRPLARLLPLGDQPEGWEVGAMGDDDHHLETFDASNLWEKIDGRAASFENFNVDGMAYANYHPEGDDSGEVQLYIFRFDTPLNTFGKYTSEKPEEAESVAIGEDGYEAAGSTSFYQDRYFVQAVSTSDDTAYADFTQALSRKISERISNGGKPTATPSPSEAVAATPDESAEPPSEPASKGATPAQMFGLLPEGPNRDRPQYVAADAFGYGFLSNVFLADYKEGDVTWQGFLRPYESPEAASEALGEYLDTLKADGANIREEDFGGLRLVVSDNYGLIDAVFVKGNAFGGANGATRAAPAESFARSFAEALPDSVPTIEISGGAGGGGGDGGEAGY